MLGDRNRICVNVPTMALKSFCFATIVAMCKDFSAQDKLSSCVYIVALHQWVIDLDV
jgi:hypothetical protein